MGEVLTVTSGTWDSPPWTPTYWYEWMRDGTVFSPHYPNNYRLRDADLGHSISVKVTATNRDGSAVATSNSLGPVTA